MEKYGVLKVPGRLEHTAKRQSSCVLFSKLYGDKQVQKRS